MSRIEDHRRELAHDGQRTHVDDEIVVSERSSALGEEDLVVARLANLGNGMTHVPGRNELAFLDVHGATGLSSSYEQIGLAAEKRRNLEDIGDFRNAPDVDGFMNVGEHRNMHCICDLAQDSQSFA